MVDKRARAPAPQSMPPPQFSVQGHAQAGGIGPTGFPHGGSTGAGEGGSSSNTLEFLVPKEQAGAVIGKGGQGLRDIRQETVSSDSDLIWCGVVCCCGVCVRQCVWTVSVCVCAWRLEKRRYFSTENYDVAPHITTHQ